MERSKDGIDEVEGDSVRVFYPKYDTEWLFHGIRGKLETLNATLSTKFS